MLHNYPNAEVEWEFRCRNSEDLTPYLAEIRYQFERLSELSLTVDQLAFLERIPFIKPDFIRFLSLFRFNLRYAFLEWLRFDGATDLTQSETDGITRDRESESWFVDPGLRVRTSENSFVRLFYRYSEITDEIEDVTNERERVGILFSIDHPFNLN